MYTHLISYSFNHPTLGEMSSSFPTTADALPIHLKKLKETSIPNSIKVLLIGDTEDSYAGSLDINLSSMG
jgi:hypothetical protein